MQFIRLLAAVAGVVIGLGILGCETQSISRVGSAPRAAISYAATATYPGNPTTSPTVRAGAVVDSRARTITIYNFGDNGIPASTMWVNRGFVSQIPAIPPRGAQVVNFNQVLQAGEGVTTLRDLGQPITSVELRTPEGLFTAEGPAHP